MKPPSPHIATRHPRGMTVIELLVVVGIVAALLSASVYVVGAMGSHDLKDEAMRMTSAMKYTWTRAAVNGAQYRMVIDLDEGTYHTEMTQAGVVREPDERDQGSEGRLPEEIIEEENEQRADTSSIFDEDEEGDPYNVRKPPTYEKAEDDALAEHAFENGVKVDQILVAYQEEPITSGKVALNFFPDGFQQPAIIVLTNEREDDYFSLVTEPLTGRVMLFSERVDDRDELVEGEEADGW